MALARLRVTSTIRSAGPPITRRQPLPRRGRRSSPRGRLPNSAGACRRSVARSAGTPQPVSTRVAHGMLIAGQPNALQGRVSALATLTGAGWSTGGGRIGAVGSAARRPRRRAMLHCAAPRLARRRPGGNRSPSDCDRTRRPCGRRGQRGPAVLRRERLPSETRGSRRTPAPMPRMRGERLLHEAPRARSSACRECPSAACQDFGIATSGGDQFGRNSHPRCCERLRFWRCGRQRGEAKAAVIDSSRDDPCGVEAGRKRRATVQIDRTEARLEPHDTAPCSRYSQRSCGVGRQRQWHGAGRHRRGGAAEDPPGLCPRTAGLSYRAYPGACPVIVHASWSIAVVPMTIAPASRSFVTATASRSLTSSRARPRCCGRPLTANESFTATGTPPRIAACASVRSRPRTASASARARSPSSCQKTPPAAAAADKAASRAARGSVRPQRRSDVRPASVPVLTG